MWSSTRSLKNKPVVVRIPRVRIHADTGDAFACIALAWRAGSLLCDYHVREGLMAEVSRFGHRYPRLVQVIKVSAHVDRPYNDMVGMVW